MTREILDYYNVHGNIYIIYEMDDNSFEIWMTRMNGNSQKISVSPKTFSLAEVRKSLQQYAQSQLRAEYHGLQERALHAKMALDKLEGSVYNLEKFRQVI